MWTNQVENIPEIWILHYPIHCVFHYLRAHCLKNIQLTPFNVLGLSSYISSGHSEQPGDFLLEVVFLSFEILGNEAKTNLTIGPCFFLDFNVLVCDSVLIKILKNLDQVLETFVSIEFFLKLFLKGFINVLLLKIFDSCVFCCI